MSVGLEISSTHAHNPEALMTLHVVHLREIPKAVRELGQRLVQVYGMLADPRLGYRAIGAIAFEAGFGDLFAFNREFRRCYGAARSGYRVIRAAANLT